MGRILKISTLPKPISSRTRSQVGKKLFHTFLVLGTPEQQRFPPGKSKQKSPLPRFDDDWDKLEAYAEHAERDEHGDLKTLFVPTDEIPDLDLGERLFLEEDLQTHHTVYVGGYTTINAVGDEFLRKERERLKRMKGKRGVLGAAKKRKAYKKGGGRHRVNGRFAKAPVVVPLASIPKIVVFDVDGVERMLRQEGGVGSNDGESVDLEEEMRREMMEID